ncbi:hypothetical protein [Pantoea eucrina]|uniref:hypothetical protein n=1 Tax=Pantoea eucrina TaxID=472693 RepID=UPI0011121AA8|nr:hypothetical protein [Pantoea eucrina]
MSQNSNTLKKIRQAIKELNLKEISIKDDVSPKGTIMLRVIIEGENTVLTIITNDLQDKLFLSILLPVEYDELANKEKAKQDKLYKVSNEFNSICRNLKCFITDAELGRMIFSTETRHDKLIAVPLLKEEMVYSIASVKSAVDIFNGLLKDN